MKKLMLILAFISVIYYVESRKMLRESCETYVTKSISITVQKPQIEAISSQEKQTRDEIESQAKLFGVPGELLLAIGWCESRLNKNAIGKKDNRDRGLFQINSYYNPDVSDECAFDVTCSSRWVASQIKSGYLWKWNSSRECWGAYKIR